MIGRETHTRFGRRNPFDLDGVAPDHLKIKNVTRAYAKTAADERAAVREDGGARAVMPPGERLQGRASEHHVETAHRAAAGSRSTLTWRYSAAIRSITWPSS